MSTHVQGDLLYDPAGNLAVSKTGQTFRLIKSGFTSCRGCCFGPHSKCKNEYDLCIKHHGPEYRDWIYVAASNNQPEKQS
jgi:hypothetical protein